MLLLVIIILNRQLNIVKHWTHVTRLL